MVGSEEPRLEAWVWARAAISSAPSLTRLVKTPRPSTTAPQHHRAPAPPRLSARSVRRPAAGAGGAAGASPPPAGTLRGASHRAPSPSCPAPRPALSAAPPPAPAGRARAPAARRRGRKVPDHQRGDLGRRPGRRGGGGGGRRGGGDGGGGGDEEEERSEHSAERGRAPVGGRCCVAQHQQPHTLCRPSRPRSRPISPWLSRAHGGMGRHLRRWRRRPRPRARAGGQAAGGRRGGRRRPGRRTVQARAARGTRGGGAPPVESARDVSN